MKFKILLVLIFYVYNVNCMADEKCNFQTCGECIRNTRDICVWCSKDDIKGPRCTPLNEVNTKNTWCGGTYYNPKPKITTLVNAPFNKTVQLMPQRIKIKTRPGLETKFLMHFEPAEDYPLDIYYLVDISYTMKTENQKLQDQAQEIYSQLKILTNNVRLGIGSFVEKPGFPLCDIYRPGAEKILCHSFKNELSLTNNMTLFTSTMAKLEFGGNYDDPEAGLDGLMQAMVCTKELDWRKEARRIIVLSTDATYHSAGDGIIVGAIKPNDMRCHLENDFYSATQALTYDYPSISQIDKIASEGNFKIVFAVNGNVSKVYELLAHDITGAKHAVLEDGKAALKIIKKAYSESAQKGPLLFKFPPFIQLTVNQSCNTDPTINCESIPPDHRTVEIEGTLIVKYCPPDNIMKRELIVNVEGIKDKLIIELEIECQCDCEKLNSTGTSHKCHDAGFIQCGICKCNPGSYGNDCRCTGTSDIIDMEKCMLNKDEKKLCSGRGTCRCGKCEDCAKGFSGDYCQFDDNACQRKDRKLCSDNGICNRGQCECYSLWTGADCSCTLDKTACITPYSKKVCSGQGKCVCGNCECDKLPNNKDGTYTGRYCDICDDCGEKRCKDLEQYVTCNVIYNKTYCDQQYNTTDTLVYFLNTTELNGPEWNMAQYCTKKLENDSCIIFKFKYDDENVVLGIQNELELAPKANIFIAVGAALGTVLLIGIITLIVWKILIDMHDKKEYEKFAKESTAQGYEVYCNDLYEPPGSTFTNPAFKGS